LRKAAIKAAHEASIGKKKKVVDQVPGTPDADDEDGEGDADGDADTDADGDVDMSQEGGKSGGAGTPEGETEGGGGGEIATFSKSREIEKLVLKVR